MFVMMMYNIGMFRLMFSYFFWHYTLALRDMFLLCKNFISFVFNFFSIGVLFRTLFSPWQKLDEKYRGGFSISSIFETFVVNLIMRCVGMLIRLSLILTGTLSICVLFAIELVVFGLWLVLPFLIVLLFVSGLRLLI
jgi:hypothetical protein